MSSVIEVIKKIVLFLFGIVLIIWGYRANAATNKEGAMLVKDGISSKLKELEESLRKELETRQTAPKTQKKEEPIKKEKAKISLSTVKKKEEKKVEVQTVIEKETPEESSGTE